MKKTRAPRFAGMLLLGAALAACGSDPFSLPEFDDSLEVDVSALTKTASGLYYQDITIGSGALATEGDSVQVGYTGRLSNGTTFDSGSFWFHVGQREVIPGFDEGVGTMREGGERKLVIPPDLGYGESSYGPIPGNSTLIFDVELLEVVTSSGG